MKVIVTGGAGFIGSHLVERLLSDGNQVIVIDDLYTGKKENLPIDKNLIFAKVSVLDDTSYLFKDVDVVYHLAALTKPQMSMKNPKATNEVNIQGTLKILENCRDYKVKRLVFVSSSAIYGPVDKYPTPENIAPILMSPYALTKLTGEHYCKLFETLYGVQANYIRPFNVFGTKQRSDIGYGAAVPSFITALSKGTLPYITGDGKQRRDFVYVDDVVDLMVLTSKSEVYGEAFNAGSGINISIGDLYDTICGLMGKAVIPNYIAPVVEPPVTLADMTKAKELLGWKQKTSLEEGLRKTIEGSIK